MGEGGEFPGPDVPGEEEDAFAAGVRALEIFESVIDDDPGDVLASVAGEEADFGELAAQRDELAAQQASAFALGHFRKRKLKIAQADTPQSTVKGVDG